MRQIESIHRKSDRPMVCLRAVGDVYFGGGIAKRRSAHTGFDPLPDLAGIMGRAQLSYCNLECVVTSGGNPSVKMSASAEYLAALRTQFDVVGVANNHTMDAGSAAFLEMLQLLEARQFLVIGGGSNKEDADSPRIVVEDGIRIGMIACADCVHTPARKGNCATSEGPGVSIFEPAATVERIRQCKKQVDILICAVHTGLEFTSYPDPRLIRDARAMVDAGANVVLVHHAHVRQGIEMFKEGLIAYGLGNFIFDIDQPYMREANAATDVGIVLDVFFDKQGVMGYTCRLSKICADGSTEILGDQDQNRGLYREQLFLNEGLHDAALIKSEWKRLCKRYLKDRLSDLYWALRMRRYKRLLHLIRSLAWRENRRWIAGLFER